MRQVFETDTWIVDIGLKVGGEFVGSGDDLRIDIPTTVIEGKTHKLFLERSGDAQLEVLYQTVYSFDVRDASRVVVSWVMGIVLPLITGAIGIGVGKVVL